MQTPGSDNSKNAPNIQNQVFWLGAEKGQPLEDLGM